MKEKLGHSPAFPRPGAEYKEEYTPRYNNPQQGMSKRYFTACMAMKGILASWPRRDMPETKGIKSAVKTAYEIADEMLKQENL